MKKKIVIISAQAEHLEGLISIFNEGFHQKFAYVSNDREKQLSFVRDFGLIDLSGEDKVFAALIDGKITGFLSLRFKGQKGKSIAPKLSFTGMIRRYGPWGLLKAARIGSAFDYNPPEGELYIDTVGVSSEARGKGVGTAMMNYAEALARNRNMKQLSLMVMFENPRAKALYERLGFKIISVKKLGWFRKSSGYSAAFFMIKEL